MFRITEDPSSGSLVQCLAKNYERDSIVPVDMDKVGVMAAYSDPLFVCVVHCIGRPSYKVKYTHAQRGKSYVILHYICFSHLMLFWPLICLQNRPPLFYPITVTICCHNTDLVHVNGHDRTF